MHLYEDRSQVYLYCGQLDFMMDLRDAVSLCNSHLPSRSPSIQDWPHFLYSFFHREYKCGSFQELPSFLHVTIIYLKYYFILTPYTFFLTLWPRGDILPILETQWLTFHKPPNLWQERWPGLTSSQDTGRLAAIKDEQIPLEDSTLTQSKAEDKTMTMMLAIFMSPHIFDVGSWCSDT